MAEYIEREKAVESCIAVRDEVKDIIFRDGPFHTDNAQNVAKLLRKFEIQMSAIPTADVVEVVRCEDSAHGCRLNREKTERGTTFTFSGGTKCTFGPESRSELFQALEKLHTLEQAMDEGRLVMRPREPYVPPKAEIIGNIHDNPELLEGGADG